jgi:hypothetical protein
MRRNSQDKFELKMDMGGGRVHPQLPPTQCLIMNQ